MFDYTNATLEQMIEHVKNSSTALISRMRQYHRTKGNSDIVKKIDMAREYAKLDKLKQRLSDLEND